MRDLLPKPPVVSAKQILPIIDENLDGDSGAKMRTVDYLGVIKNVHNTYKTMRIGNEQNGPLFISPHLLN